MRYFKLGFLFSMIVTCLFANQINKNNAEMPAIVPTAWLKENTTNPRLVIVDLRTQKEYKAGHIKNSINIPALKNLFDEKFLIPKLDILKELLSNAGIDKDSLVLAYDNGDFIWSARFYWLLETLGHTNVGILKFGYGEKLKKEFPVSMNNYKAQRKEFIIRVDNEKIQTKLSTLLAIGKKTIIV